MSKRIYPRIKLQGTDLLNRVGVIYSQILNDLLMKVDDGSGKYEKGFLHTSTVPYTEPNYYHETWSRDGGRGIQELARAGLINDARSVIDYVLRIGKSFGDHYGRLLDKALGSHEIDGNVYMLMSFYSVWKYSGKSIQDAKTYIENAKPIFAWFKELADKSPYGALLASKSELSGNPDTPYFIYALFATYGAAVACRAFAEMADNSGMDDYANELKGLRGRFLDSLKEQLTSQGKESKQATKTPAGVWLNGIDERTGKAAEVGDFGPEFDISRWTRQLPFIQDYDMGTDSTEDEVINKINERSYKYIREGMAGGYLFRRYGFVSNTCFNGMGGRHDDTMAGYGQNFFTQAALLSDDVNTYTKCLDGIARLAYDGDIVAPLTVDLNPWVMHECFTYENFEKGLDHTYGRTGNETLHIMHNPGDEGNLVQSAETLKSLALVAGITTGEETLIIKPRLPWECTEALVKDFPAVTPDGLPARISYEFKINRWENRYIIKINGVAPFKKISVRIGPLPNVLCNEADLMQEWIIERKYCASFASKVIMNEGKDEIEVILVNEVL